MNRWIKRSTLCSVALCTGLLGSVSLLSACAPQVNQSVTQPVTRQPVQVWEGSARVLLSMQDYRLSFTENPRTHELRGTLENLSSKDSFEATGTLLPTRSGATLTAEIRAGNQPRLNASILGFGISNISLKADAQLSGTITQDLFLGSLRVNGIRYTLNMKRTCC